MDDVLRADAKYLSACVFRSHTVAVGITYARTLKSRQLLFKPQKNTAVTIGGIFLCFVNEKATQS